MVELPRLELSDISDRTARAASDLVARGHGLADHLRSRVKGESRSFADREARDGHDHGGAAAALALMAASPTVRLLGAAAVGFAVGVALNPARKAAMQGVEAVAGDWMGVLKAEHRLVEALFAAALKTTPRQKARRGALFLKIKRALIKHALQEETVVYPALRESQADGMAKHLYADHADIKILLSQIEALPKSDPAWIERMRALQACVAHHVREEEDEVFPAFHDRLTPQQSTRLTLMLHREGMKLA